MKMRKAITISAIYLTGCICCRSVVSGKLNNPGLYSLTSWPGAVVAAVLNYKSYLDHYNFDY